MVELVRCSSRVLGTVGVIALAGLVTGCSLGGADRSEVRAGAVYEAVVRSMVGPVPEGAERPVVFVEPRGEGAEIGVEVEAELIGAVDDVASIRFIDEREEALTEVDGKTVVRDDGLLIRLGPVVEEGSLVLLEVDRFVAGDDFESYRFELRASGDQWRVVEPPEPLPGG